MANTLADLRDVSVEARQDVLPRTVIHSMWNTATYRNVTGNPGGRDGSRDGDYGAGPVNSRIPSDY